MDTQREGWLDDEYVRIYASSDRLRIAGLYRLHEFLPGYELWGSFGLDALCLGADAKLYVIPWVPLAEAHRKERYANVAEFTRDVASLHEASASYEHFGKEVHLVKPIVFGGDPEDPSNLMMLDQFAHAEICQYWNRVYARSQTTNA